MLEPHLIRLRGPWLLEPLSRCGDPADLIGPLIGEQLQVDVPSDWSGVLGSGFRGRVKYTRRFGRPTGLSPQHRVYLCVKRVNHAGEVELNGCPLGTVDYEEMARFDITSLLEQRNELNIEVTLLAASDADTSGHEVPAGGLIGEIYLEILE